MGSFNSSALRQNGKVAARSAVEAAVVGGLLVLAAAAVFKGPAERKGLFIGSIAAWAASSLSTTGLLISKAHASPVKAFWYAFGGGMGLRLAVLAVLMAYGYQHDAALSQPALLLSYAFGVLIFLLLESRHIKLK